MTCGNCESYNPVTKECYYLLKLYRKTCLPLGDIKGVIVKPDLNVDKKCPGFELKD